jgi:hypothetical protein
MATENAVQPHTGLIAISPLDEGKRLVFASYGNTRKFADLMQNPKDSLPKRSRAAQPPHRRSMTWCCKL